MLTEYIEAAMKRAKYELLEGGEGYFATIAGFRGLWANERTLRGCRKELRSVLESWLIIKLRHDDNDFPVLAGINLNTPRRRRAKVA
ncbi:MAG: type II toxin-antitoxin system HicB family antitoxin [Tepidisphaeraceae bacterium]